MQSSLVSYYGKKDNNFCELILSIQKLISDRCGEGFVPYSIEQIHSTIVSLERLDNSSFVNKNFAQMRKSYVEMDFQGLMDYLRISEIFPIHIQVGGFENRDYGFLSRDQYPYTRTFSIQGRFANVIGWPFVGSVSGGSDGIFKLSPAVGELRKGLEPFNILHSYHQSDADFDNDFYFRVGIFDENAASLNYQVALEDEIRELLSKSEPLYLTLNPENIFLVFYADQRLPFESSTAWSLVDPIISPDFIKTKFQSK